MQIVKQCITDQRVAFPLTPKDLDATGYVRFNGEDHSRLAWLELRHHWPQFDLTLQLQYNLGSAGTPFVIERSVTIQGFRRHALPRFARGDGSRSMRGIGPVREARNDDTSGMKPHRPQRHPDCRHRPRP